MVHLGQPWASSEYGASAETWARGQASKEGRGSSTCCPEEGKPESRHMGCNSSEAAPNASHLALSLTTRWLQECGTRISILVRKKGCGRAHVTLSSPQRNATCVIICVSRLAFKSTNDNRIGGRVKDSRTVVCKICKRPWNLLVQIPLFTGKEASRGD